MEDIFIAHGSQEMAFFCGLQSFAFQSETEKRVHNEAHSNAFNLIELAITFVL